MPSSSQKRASPDDDQLRDRLAVLRAKIEDQRRELSQLCPDLVAGPDGASATEERETDHEDEGGAAPAPSTARWLIRSALWTMLGSAVGVATYAMQPWTLNAIAAASGNTTVGLGSEGLDGPSVMWAADPSMVPPRARPSARRARIRWSNASSVAPHVPVPPPTPANAAAAVTDSTAAGPHVPLRPQPDPTPSNTPGEVGPWEEPDMSFLPRTRTRPAAALVTKADEEHFKTWFETQRNNDTPLFRLFRSRATFQIGATEDRESWIERIQEECHRASLSANEKSVCRTLLQKLGAYPALETPMDLHGADYNYIFKASFTEFDAVRLMELTKRVFTVRGTLMEDFMQFLTHDDVKFIEWAAPQIANRSEYQEYVKKEGESDSDYDTRVMKVCEASESSAIKRMCPPYLARKRRGFTRWSDMDAKTWIEKVVSDANQKAESMENADHRKIARLLVNNVYGSLLGLRQDRESA
jgi:hypothetical protein